MKKIIPVLVLAGLIVAWQQGVFARIFEDKKVDDGFFSGIVEATELKPGFKLPGRITVLIEEGQVVKKGDVLARIESDEYKIAYNQAESALLVAKTQLEEMKNGFRPREIAQAEEALALSCAEFEKAQKDYERAQQLYKQKVMSQAEFDALQNVYEIKKAQKASSNEKVLLMKEGTRKEQIQAQEYRIQQAESGVAAAKERLSQTEINAPESGIITGKYFENGEIIQAGTPVCSITLLDKPWVQMYVKETKLGRLKLGQPATVSIDTFPGKEYTGTISYISERAEFVPKNVQTTEDRMKLVFLVKVMCENNEFELKPGMPADVRLW